jgi:hypothetical protein
MSRPTRIRRFQTLGSVLSLEKLGQTFFAVIMTKTPLLMGFLVYELNCRLNYYWFLSFFTVLIKILLMHNGCHILFLTRNLDVLEYVC